MHCSSTNLDEIELAETFKTRIDMGEHDPKYEHVEWVVVDDRTPGSYKKKVEFDTTSVIDKLPIYRESYILFPLRMKSSDSNNAYDMDTMLAWKGSVLTLIRSLTVKAGNLTLVNSNDGAVPLINNLKLLTCADLDWIHATGSELSFFGADRQVLSQASETHILPSSSQIAKGFPNHNMYGNQQLTDRVTIMSEQMRTDGDGWLNMHVYIPLKYIHPLFDQMRTPLPNCPLRIAIGLSSVSNGDADLMPITTPGMAAHYRPTVVNTGTEAAPVWEPTLVRDAVALPADAPILELSQDVEIDGFAPGACRLYVKTVVLKPADQKRLDSEMGGPGYKKTITYTVTDYHDKKPIEVKNGEASLVHVFGNNTKRPVRVWALFPPTGALSDPLSTFPATIGQVQLKDVNLLINNTKFRAADFETQKELYNELRAYMLGSGYSTTQGAQISYNDFTHGMNPYLFDLSRNPTVRNNLPVTFKINGKLISANDTVCDAIFLVERYMTVVFNITNNKAEVTEVEGLKSEA